MADVETREGLRRARRAQIVDGLDIACHEQNTAMDSALELGPRDSGIVAKIARQRIDHEFDEGIAECATDIPRLRGYRPWVDVPRWRVRVDLELSHVDSRAILGRRFGKGLLRTRGRIGVRVMRVAVG